jgi:hypothetical protein
MAQNDNLVKARPARLPVFQLVSLSVSDEFYTLIRRVFNVIELALFSV